MLKFKFLISSLFFIQSIHLYAQEFSGKSLLLDAGFGIFENTELEGIGLVHSIGAEFDVHDRIRIVPRFTFGGFVADADGGSNGHFVSRVLKLNVGADIVNYKSLSFVINAGILGNYSSGYKTGRNHNFFHTVYFAVGGSFGLRLMPTSARFGCEFNLLELMVSPFDEDVADGVLFRTTLIYRLFKNE